MPGLCLLSGELLERLGVPKYVSKKTTSPHGFVSKLFIPVPLQWKSLSPVKLRNFGKDPWFLGKAPFCKSSKHTNKANTSHGTCLESAFVVYLKSEAVDSMLVRHSHMYSYVIYALQYGQIIFKHASLVVSTVSTRLKSSFDSESMDWSKRNLTKPCPP